MNKIIIEPFGELAISRPNLAAALDLIATWGDNPNRAKIGRLCAAALGLCLPGANLPGYSMIDCDPIAYGGQCLDRLLRAGLTASQVYEHGVLLINYCAELLPSEKEVKEAENFTIHPKAAAV